VVDRMEKTATSFINQISRTPYRKDDTADLLAEMPAAVAKEVLRSLNHQGRQIHPSPAYAEDSAGGIMGPAIVSVSKNTTVAQAIAKIRAAAIDQEFHTVFVVDDQGRFVGEVGIRLLLTQPEEACVESLVDRSVPSVRVDTTRQEVRDLLIKHRLTSMPVVDYDGRLVGQIPRNGG
jgi:magnesium transporter